MWPGSSCFYVYDYLKYSKIQQTIKQEQIYLLIICQKSNDFKDIFEKYILLFEISKRNWFYDFEILYDDIAVSIDCSCCFPALLLIVRNTIGIDLLSPIKHFYVYSPEPELLLIHWMFAIVLVCMKRLSCITKSGQLG